jgi:phosphonate transport system substrate-binding protein
MNVTQGGQSSGTISVLPVLVTVFRLDRWILAIAVLLLLGSCCRGMDVDERGWPRELVLGLVPALEAEALVDNLDPLTDHLEAELGIPVRSFVPQDYTGLVEALGSGRADIGMLPPFAAMLGARRYDIETILISVRKGETGYRPQWFTNDPSVCETEIEYVERVCESRQVGRASEIRRFAQCQGSLESMRGDSVAFVEPNSTSGFLFPAVQLMQMGIEPETDIRSLFVGRHDATVLAVYAGDTRFGVSYDDARNMVCGRYPDIGEKVIVFEYAPMLPNDGVQVREGLPADLRQGIMDAFVGLAESQAHLPDDEKVLWILYEIDGFVPLTEGLYDPVREAYELRRR